MKCFMEAYFKSSEAQEIFMSWYEMEDIDIDSAIEKVKPLNKAFTKFKELWSCV